MASYELVNTRDWPKHIEDNGHIDPYGLQSLDVIWYPLLSGRLQRSQTNGRDYAHHLDVTDSSDRRFQSEYSGDDIDGRGKFDAREFEKELKSMSRRDLEDKLGVSYHKISEIIRRADINRTGEVDYKDFLNVVRNYRLSTEQASTLKSVAYAFAYAEEFTCYPPTVFMIFVTFIETAFFIYHVVHLPEAHNLKVTWDGPVPYCSVLIYNPKRRWEVWRFFTYMCVHIGIGHFVFNMLMQIIVGVFLEMQQEGWIGSVRVLVVYMSGVLAGSLGTSLSDPHTYIAGASGGVYALIAAHLATLALNWQEDSAVKIRKVIFKPLTRIVRLIFIITLTLHDIGFAIYVRYFSETENNTGFMGHFCGALAGLLVGIFVLDNRRIQSWETFIQWISIGIFTLLMGFAILWNVFGDTWYKELYGVGRFFPKPDYQLYDDASGNCKHYHYL